MRHYETSVQELKDKSLPVLPLAVHPAAPRALPPSKALEAATALTDKLTDDQLIHMVVGEVSRGQGSALGSAGIAVPGAAGETSSILEEPYGIPGSTCSTSESRATSSAPIRVREREELPT